MVRRTDSQDTRGRSLVVWLNSSGLLGQAVDTPDAKDRNNIEHLLRSAHVYKQASDASIGSRKVTNSMVRHAARPSCIFSAGSMNR